MDHNPLTYLAHIVDAFERHLTGNEGHIRLRPNNEDDALGPDYVLESSGSNLGTLAARTQEVLPNILVHSDAASLQSPNLRDHLAHLLTHVNAMKERYQVWSQSLIGTGHWFYTGRWTEGLTPEIRQTKLLTTQIESVQSVLQNIPSKIAADQDAIPANLANLQTRAAAFIEGCNTLHQSSNAGLNGLLGHMADHDLVDPYLTECLQDPGNLAKHKGDIEDGPGIRKMCKPWLKAQLETAKTALANRDIAGLETALTRYVTGMQNLHPVFSEGVTCNPVGDFGPDESPLGALPARMHSVEGLQNVLADLNSHELVLQLHFDATDKFTEALQHRVRGTAPAENAATLEELRTLLLDLKAANGDVFTHRFVGYSALLEGPLAPVEGLTTLITLGKHVRSASVALEAVPADFAQQRLALHGLLKFAMTLSDEDLTSALVTFPNCNDSVRQLLHNREACWRIGGALSGVPQYGAFAGPTAVENTLKESVELLGADVRELVWNGAGGAFHGFAEARVDDSKWLRFDAGCIARFKTALGVGALNTLGLEVRGPVDNAGLLALTQILQQWGDLPAVHVLYKNGENQVPIDIDLSNLRPAQANFAERMGKLRFFLPVKIDASTVPVAQRVEALQGLASSFPHTTSLSLNGWAVDEGDCDAIRDELLALVSKLPHLKTLDLTGTNLAQEGLMGALHAQCPSLLEVKHSDGTTDAFAALLAATTELTWGSPLDPHHTTEGLQELLTAYPNMRTLTVHPQSAVDGVEALLGGSPALSQIGRLDVLALPDDKCAKEDLFLTGLAPPLCGSILTQHAGTVQHLTLRDVNLSKKVKDALAECTELRTLDLRGCSASTDIIPLLVALPNLTDVKLPTTLATGKTPLEECTFDNVILVRDLALASDKFRPYAWGAYTGDESHRWLLQLALAQKGVSIAGKDAGETLDSAKFAVWLSAFGGNMADAPVMPDVKTVTIEYNAMLTTAQLALLGEKFPALESLTIKGCPRLTDAGGIALIAGLRENCPNITHLNLSGNPGITNDTFKNGDDVRALPNTLTHLNITGTAVTDAVKGEVGDEYATLANIVYEDRTAAIEAYAVPPADIAADDRRTIQNDDGSITRFVHKDHVGERLGALVGADAAVDVDLGNAVTQPVFDAFIEYLYKDALPANMTVETTKGLYELAHTHNLDALKAKCNLSLRSAITVDNVADIWAFATNDAHPEPGLKKQCWLYAQAFMRSNTSAAIQEILNAPGVAL